MDESTGANKLIRRLALGFAVFCALFIATLWLFPRKLTPTEVAARHITLPTQAIVVSAVEGDWSGDVDVEFKLPSTQSPEKWLKKVWTGLGYPISGKPSKYQLVWDSGGSEYRSLTYSPSRQIYTYSCMLEK